MPSIPYIQLKRIQFPEDANRMKKRVWHENFNSFAKNLADPHERDEDGGTLLHWSAAYGCKAGAFLLLQQGLDINAVDKHGNTPLHEAILAAPAARHIAFWLAQGADCRLANAAGLTPAALKLQQLMTTPPDTLSPEELGGLFLLLREQATPLPDGFPDLPALAPVRRLVDAANTWPAEGDDRRAASEAWLTEQIPILFPDSDDKWRFAMTVYGTISIPPTLGFIWMGKPLPEEYLMTIKHLAAIAERSDFQIQLVVDSPSKFQRACATADVTIPNLEVISLDEELDDLLSDPFYTEADRKDLKRFIYAEMIGNKNYAAASDLIRLLRLFKHGGYYLDTDSQFSIEELRDKTTRLQVDTPEYGFLGSAMGISSTHQFKGVNNDLIAACPGHPIIREAIQRALRTFREMEQIQVAPQSERMGFFKMIGNMMDHPIFERTPHSRSPDFKKTLMDSKRSFYDTEDWDEDHRLQLTINSAGPETINGAMFAFVRDQQKTNHLFREALLFPTNMKGTIVAGLTISAHAPALWTKKTDEVTKEEDSEEKKDFRQAKRDAQNFTSYDDSGGVKAPKKR